MSELLIEPDISLLTLEALLFVRSTEVPRNLSIGGPSCDVSESEKIKQNSGVN